MHLTLTSGSVVCRIDDDPLNPESHLVVVSVDVDGRHALCRMPDRQTLKVLDVATLQMAVVPQPEAVDDDAFVI